MPVTKKATRAEAGRFQSGVSGNPAGRPPGPVRLERIVASFAHEHADLLLGAALKHAIESPSACTELVKMVFGANWRPRDVRQLLGPLDTLDDCRMAEHRATHERAYGHLPGAKFREVMATIEARRETLAASDPTDQIAPELEPQT